MRLQCLSNGTVRYIFWSKEILASSSLQGWLYGLMMVVFHPSDHLQGGAYKGIILILQLCWGHTKHSDPSEKYVWSRHRICPLGLLPSLPSSIRDLSSSFGFKRVTRKLLFSSHLLKILVWLRKLMILYLYKCINVFSANRLLALFFVECHSIHSRDNVS